MGEFMTERQSITVIVVVASIIVVGLASVLTRSLAMAVIGLVLLLGVLGFVLGKYWRSRR